MGEAKGRCLEALAMHWRDHKQIVCPRGTCATEENNMGPEDKEGEARGFLS